MLLFLALSDERKREGECLGKGGGGGDGVRIMCHEIESRLQRVGLLLTPNAQHRKCWEIDCSPSESVLFTLINLYSPG